MEVVIHSYRHRFGVQPFALGTKALSMGVYIDIDTELAYFPIVRLALVRYQARALDGCHVSPVVCWRTSSRPYRDGRCP